MGKQTFVSEAHEDGLPMEPQLPELSLRNFRNSNRMKPLVKFSRLPKQKDILETLKDFWRENKNPDFLVQIGEHNFPCHRLILMVYVLQVRQNREKLELRLPEDSVKPEVFDRLYRWMNDREPLLKRSKILDLLTAAYYLKLDELSNQVWHCLDQDTLSGEHQAIQVAQDALHAKDLLFLHYMMLLRIQHFFLTFVSSVEFLALPLKSLCYLLSSDEIMVNSEAEVFYAAIRWLNHEWPTRQIHMMEVMDKVRLSRMPNKLLLMLESPVDDIRVDRIIQSPELKTRMEKACLDQVLEQFNDGKRVYRQIYEIFNVTFPQPRGFICHDLATYHEPKPNSPVQVFSYADFLNYLGVLQTLPPNTLQLLRNQR
ncbi:kelch-like protein 4 [Drosophila rhopaloa]|uniref:Kelch-like protein 4 n=1 Tax=Drosophila rhopaloa TaxID=1041015 RepID=A0A6P4ENN5_DRORH|nr:kelch-like protein 4 [Drosophila rhopaloa]